MNNNASGPNASKLRVYLEDMDYIELEEERQKTLENIDWFKKHLNIF